MLFKYYFLLWLNTIVGYRHSFGFIWFFLFCLLVILDCQGGLSCVPLVSFMNFFFFFDNEKLLSMCFYTCIYWWSSHLICSQNTPCSCFGPLRTVCVLLRRTAHKNMTCLFQIEWYHLIVNAVAKRVFFLKSDKFNSSSWNPVKMS